MGDRDQVAALEERGRMPRPYAGRESVPRIIRDKAEGEDGSLAGKRSKLEL